MRSLLIAVLGHHARSDRQIRRFRELGPAGRLELGCSLIDLAHELAEGAERLPQRADA